ncbi:exodeoxyribonuclease I [Candidatus Saccharibacteria bacterium]|nr:exodeoxyribonuclease I [Candidatus Saccharibacteria bacterium]
MNKTFFFYDLETSGLRPREDRIMQFAGQRTDMDLNPIGEPVNILVKMTNDALPNPGAIMVTKITPQKTLEDGYTEAEFCKIVTEEIFTPDTIAVGYNTVRFDDEFMRAILWRSFYDPYEWEWKDGRSRWDMLDVVRMVRALRPEGINWPVTNKGKATNRLELLTKLNGLEHAHAHDALSDVYATIAVAKLIREKQPKMFEFLFKMRDKKEVQKLVNLENKQPFVFTSGRYNADFDKTTVVVPITTSRNGNVLVYDLRYNLDELMTEDEPKFYPVVKELCYNKCPAVAPLSVLNDENWKTIGLTKEQIDRNLASVMAHPEFAEKMRTENEEKTFEPVEEPEQALYDGFLNDMDRIKVAAVRNADGKKLADFHPDFIDERLPELLLHYKGRNFPESLSEKEAEEWEKYRKARLEKYLPKFLEELNGIYEQDDFIAEELKLYLENIL